MKNRKKNWMVVAAAASILSACNKEGADNSSDSIFISEGSTIAVPGTAAAVISGVAADSIYILGSCKGNENRESVDSADVPIAALTYLEENYQEYLFHSAYMVKDSTSTVTGYVVILYYNDRPVAVKFSSSGTFEKVLEQREKDGPRGNGYRRGGRFQHRDGQHRDSISLANLPAAVTDYFTSTYPGDTLFKAFTNADSSILVISKNNGIYATLFTPTGTFNTRVELPSPHGEHSMVSEEALPATITYYLDTTFPGYVFEKAFSESANGTIKRFVVVIDANNTKYAIAFDASGNFLGAKVIYYFFPDHR